ncbi:MAG: diguanylate cyclase [Acidimicrobiales bacterium]|nr:diguanylate cyclase [Acidimicrobiales bacterium]
MHPDARPGPTTLQPMPELVVVCESMGPIRWASPSSRSLLGHVPEELIGTDLADLLHPEDREPWRTGQPLTELVGVHEDRPLVVRFLRSDGSWLPMQVAVNDLQRIAGAGEPDDAVVITAFDFAGPLHPGDTSNENGVILERIARGAPVLGTLEGVALGLSRRLGFLGVVVSLAEAGEPARTLSTAVPNDLLTMLEHTAVIRPRTPDEVEPGHRVGPPTARRSAAWSAVVAAASGGALHGCWAVDLVTASGPAARLVVLHPDDRVPSPIEATLMERAGDLVALAVERLSLQTRLERHRHHDELTGLANRRLLMSRMPEAFAAHPGSGLGLLSVDIDGFTLINDSLGPDAGDRLLREVARRFVRAVRPDDLVARVGRDEFAVLCPGVEDEDELVGLAERVGAALREPVNLGTGPVFVTASVGVVRAAEPADPALLLRDADLALCEARRRGRGQQARFVPDLRARSLVRFDLEVALREALRRDELRLAYQPIVSLADGSVHGVEALLRWERPGIGLAGPDGFVPVATETGLILPIGRWAIERAVLDATGWGGIAVSVNLSASQLADPRLVPFVADVLERHGLPPRLLWLEVTESDLAVEPAPSAEVLRHLAETGVRLAIDDFGTGFATLDYLRRYSMAHAVKVDGSFVAGLDDLSGPDLPIVSAALMLARNLGLETVAEGIETDEQREILRRLGCDRGQGHLFSEPMPAAEVVPWMARRRRRGPSA